ncbi:DUF4174 domain-containing protein [Xaviernesmea oryzae]|uniref:DUF4174 domain-containing protein n=1 Tax=Xaviernesmea oryzae TaxID=464029 RepID=A0A1X7FXA0_9HYPH|nr:DUF4174 domain-containing protein [Xaviernesmea oryzae]SMF60406.1 protein of unknown function [Xaviernesmea oryzae]
MPQPQWMQILWSENATTSGETAAGLVPDKRVLVLFEDNLSPVRKWQSELLKLDQEALRAMDIAIVCVSSDDAPSMINGRPQALPVDELRRELQGGAGKFEAILVDKDAGILLRSDTPVTIAQIQEVVGRDTGAFERQ